MHLGVVASLVFGITLLGIALIGRVGYPCLGILFSLVLVGFFRVVVFALLIGWVKWLKRSSLFVMIGSPALKFPFWFLLFAAPFVGQCFVSSWPVSFSLLRGFSSHPGCHRGLR